MAMTKISPLTGQYLKGQSYFNEDRDCYETEILQYNTMGRGIVIMAVFYHDEESRNHAASLCRTLFGIQL